MSDKMKAALGAVQHYLLVLPQGAHKEILYQIADALKDQSKMPTALHDVKYYLLKYAGDHIQNIADAGAEEIPALLRQIDNALEISMKCKYCGCTDDNACEGGCSWVAKDVCSKCASELVRVINKGNGAILSEGVESHSTGILKNREIFVPVEAMIFTAENLLNTYQEITGEKIRLKLGAETPFDYLIRHDGD